MKIEVRPIIKKQWHGKTGKESYTRTKKIQALVGDDYKYATGLSDEDIAWLKEKKNGKPRFDGDLSDNFDPQEPHPFWDSRAAVVELKNSTQIFDTELPLDRIKVCIMKASSRVANSMKEYEEGIYDEATHVIFDEKEEIDVKASKLQIKNNAIIRANELSVEKKANIIQILSGKNIKGKSNGAIEVELSKLIEKDAKSVNRIMDRDNESVVVEALILDALDANILKKKGHKYYYFDNYLGGSVEDLVDYFRQDDNQELRFTIISKLEKK